MNFLELQIFLGQFIFAGECALLYYFCAMKNTRGYILKRSSPIDNIDKVMIAPEIKKCIDSAKSEIDENLLSGVESFIINLKSICNEKNLNIFSENMSTLKVTQLDKEPFSKNKKVRTVGYYSPSSNEVCIRDELGKDKSLYHELFHASSSVYKGESLYSGFQQSGAFGEIGLGLNEGYTELLASRNFESLRKSYRLEIEFAKIVEKIVGKDRMLELYLTANLKDLIIELSLNTSTEFVIAILTNLDYISKKHILKSKELIDYQERINFVYNSLVFIRMTQLEDLYKGNKIVKAEHLKELLILDINRCDILLYLCDIITNPMRLDNDLLAEKIEELTSVLELNEIR